MRSLNRLLRAFGLEDCTTLSSQTVVMRCRAGWNLEREAQKHAKRFDAGKMGREARCVNSARKVCADPIQ